MRLSGLAALLLIAPLAGCGPAGGDPEAGATLGRGTVAPMGTPVWASGRTVHVGPDTVDLPAAADAIDDVVNTAGGVYAVARDRVWVMRGARAVDTGVRTDEPLVVSPDGRYLAYLDTLSGPTDSFDTPLAAAVVWDTRTGHRVASSSAGMGDVGDDDLADLYEDSEIGVFGYAGHDLVVDTTDGNRRIDLRTGRSDQVPEDPDDLGGLAGANPPVSTVAGTYATVIDAGGRVRDGAGAGFSSFRAPGKRYAVVLSGGAHWRFADADRLIEGPGLPRPFGPGPWLSPSTLLVLTGRGQAVTGLLRCDLDARRCTSVAWQPELGEHPVLPGGHDR